MGGGVGIGEAVDLDASVLKHGGPQVRERSIFLLGLPVLTMLQAFKSTTCQEAGNVGVTVSRAQSPTVVYEAVVKKSATIRIEWILDTAELVDEARV